MTSIDLFLVQIWDFGEKKKKAKQTNKQNKEKEKEILHEPLRIAPPPQLQRQAQLL